MARSSVTLPRGRRARMCAAALCAGALAASLPAGAGDRLLWGDTHLHTANSFDAFLNGNHDVTPDVAYSFARGEPVIHPYNRTRVQLHAPLDFLVVSDHAEFMGGIRDIYFDGIQDPDAGFIRRIAYWYNEWKIRDAIDSGQGNAYFSAQLPSDEAPEQAARNWGAAVTDAIPGAQVSQSRAWQEVRDAAARHDQPGVFTALLGWEWSSTPGGANLHRIVVTDAAPAQAADFTPYSSAESPYPDDLWRWMDETAARTGVRFIAIPHNSNISKGRMFGTTTLRGAPIDAAYATASARHEPLVEITQIKGDSEIHPSLSPDDPFAGYAPYPHYIQQQPGEYQPSAGDFVRSAWRRGLEIERTTGVNPYTWGVIGSTDSHTGLSSAEERNFWGKMAVDSIPENKARASVIGSGPSGWSMAAAGLAAVWAEDNTRAAIVDAMLRKETYSSTGPRIRVRFYGGAGFTAEDAAAADPATAGKARGVPMGADLPPGAVGAGNPPSFLVHALRDPDSAPLDRVQIVKGWIDADNVTHERIFDVAWSDDRAPDADGVVPPIASVVDHRTGAQTAASGATELRAAWQDPTFDPAQPAFWYARVLEVPTVSHAQLDATALGLAAPSTGASEVQERAITSPIRYRPAPPDATARR